MSADPWAELRGVPVPIRERCGANTRTKIGHCQNERDLCGLHPRVRRYPYKSKRPRPDGRTERARRNHEERQRMGREALAEERRQSEEEVWRRIQHSNPPENPGPARRSAVASQYPAPAAREPTLGRERQPPAQESASPDLGPTDGPLPDDGSPECAAIARVLGFPAAPARSGEGFRSERLRHLSPGGRRQVAERQWGGPDDDPPDGDGEPLPEAM